ncbi:hypothetical protein D3C71_2077840 [compost metagenome]
MPKLHIAEEPLEIIEADEQRIAVACIIIEHKPEHPEQRVDAESQCQDDAGEKKQAVFPKAGPFGHLLFLL